MPAKSSAQSVSNLLSGGVAMESLESRKLLAAVGTLVGGVDPYNMGKGDWIWDMTASRTNTNTASVQAFVDYAKAKGFKWLVVKAGDGNTGPGTGLYAQFNKDLVSKVHAAGMKIFAYQFVYGGVTPNSKNATTTIAGEKAVIDKIMAVGGDGLIFDAEGDWEKLSNANSVAEGYGKYFKDRYPTKLLGYSGFAYANLHSKYPYQGLGKYADVAMPQMYWNTISIAGTPQQILTDVDSAWKTLYNGFAAAGKSDSIKPIVPIGQGYDDAGGFTPSFEVAQFFDLLRNDADPASPFGYNGVGWWNAQTHTPDIWTAIGNGSLSAPTGSISGNVFNDLDGDGIKDLNETGVSNRIVYDDTNSDGKRDAYEPFIKTNSSGNYTLPYMAGRTHRIRQEVPAGTRQSYPLNGAAQTVIMTAGQKPTDRDFATTPMALVSGTIFNDFDANGAKASTEPVLSGWTVFIDSNTNGVLDAGEPTTTSNSKGVYTFTVAAGNHQLREIPAAGYRITSPVSVFYDFTVGAGESTLKFFGNTTSVLISGSVFNDKDGDGAKESGELGLKGWRVWVDADGDGVFDDDENSVLTDSTGKYRFNNIGGGTYRIQVFIPVGWHATIPGSAARKITIASGGTTSNKNFGVAQNA